MKMKQLTIVLSLATLLGAGLALPGSAAAHDSDSRFRAEQGHQPRMERHHQQPRDYGWYLQRHRELRPYGHSHHHHMKGRHHHRGDRYYPTRQHRRDHHHHPAPVRLELGYEIVL